MSAPPVAKGSSAVKGCRPARISCANPAALPRTTTSFMSAIVSTPVGKRIFTNDSLLRMRMYLYPPILGSPHFWQTDKARFLKEQRRCWAGGQPLGSMATKNCLKIGVHSISPIFTVSAHLLSTQELSRITSLPPNERYSALLLSANVGGELAIGPGYWSTALKTRFLRGGIHSLPPKREVSKALHS